jgi:hypothetical protein
MTECTEEGCHREARRRGLCWAHIKRTIPSRGARPPSSTPVAERGINPQDRLAEAIHSYVDAESDEEFSRARDNLRKVIAAARPSAIGELTREALAALKAQGVRLGRPPKVKAEAAVLVIQAAPSVRVAAEQLGVSARTLYRLLRRVRTDKMDPFRHL